MGKPETLEEILDDVPGLFDGPYCQEAVAGIANDAHSAGIRSGLLRAARRASAMAGQLECICSKWDGHACGKHRLLDLAAKLREEAGEG